MSTRDPQIGQVPARFNWLPLAGRLWPWLLLTAATVFFVVKFIPGFFLASMDTETIVLPVFYQDIAVANHSPADWSWGGFSALFPDILLYWGLNALLSDGMVSLQLLQGCFFTAWLCATVALVIELDRPNKLALFSILLLLWVGLVFNFGFPDGWGIFIQRSLLQPIYHSGMGILTSICLVLLLRQISKGWGIGFWWLFVLTFLGEISDTLFVPVFIGSGVVTVALLALAFRDKWKWYLTLGGNLTVAGVSGYLLAPHFFPPKLATADYLRFGWDRVDAAIASITAEFFRSDHHIFALVMVLDILTVLGGLGGLLYFFFSPRGRRMSPVVFSLMAFCSCSIFANWTAVILTGDYVDINANRYTTIALLIPLFIVAFGLHAIILWRPWLEKLFAVSISAFTISVAFIPQEHNIAYTGNMMDIPLLEKIMQDHDIHACLGSYWCANIANFLSHGQVPTRSLTNDAKIYKWFTSLEWFGKGHPVSEWPHFRLIYGPDHGYSEVFGPPDEDFRCPSGAEVWVYSEEHSIRYNEYFDVLSNSLLDGGRTVQLNPSSLPGGPHVDGHARVASEADGEGWLEYGPNLVLEPGRYRAAFHYTFSVLPTPDRVPRYDLLVHTGRSEQSFHGQLLPCPDTTPQVLTDEFTVTEPNHVYEMRIFYHGSGTIRVNALNLSYLGK